MISFNKECRKHSSVFLTSSERPSTSASSTRTQSYCDNEEKYDNEMSDNSTSNEDLERSNNDK